MTDWSDEDMSAYLDAELDPAKAAALEADLEHDAALRARLEALAGVDEAVRAAFDAPLHEATPERIGALFRAAPSAPVDLAAVRAARRGGDVWRLPLAAGIALAIGAAGGLLAGRALAPAGEAVRIEAGLVGPGSRLHALLEETPSATSVALNGGARFQPVLTLIAADGRACREFELVSPAATTVALACRGEAGWHVEVAAAGAPAAAGTGGYAQAAGAGAAAVETALDQLGAGDPLSGEAEAALMKGGWRR